MKERFQATITHLRENIRSAIESDLRDFGGSSHLPYDGSSIVARGGIEATWRSTDRAGSLRTEPFLPEGNLGRRFTRHGVNSAFTAPS
jgi:hypothetical protein